MYLNKGGSSPVFFLFGSVFFVFFLKKKTENCNFGAVLGFWKKAGFSLIGIQKYWEFFFGWAGLGSLNFTIFLPNSGFTVVYWFQKSNMVFQVYFLTSWFFFITENCTFSAVLGFWKMAGSSLVGIPKYRVFFSRLGRAGFPEFHDFFAEFWFYGGILVSEL